jgi:hypothetical protein
MRLLPTTPKRELLTQAAARQRQALEKAPADRVSRALLEKAYLRLAVVQGQLGRTADAAATRLKLQELRQADPKPKP